MKSSHSPEIEKSPLGEQYCDVRYLYPYIQCVYSNYQHLFVPTLTECLNTCSWYHLLTVCVPAIKTITK